MKKWIPIIAIFILIIINLFVYGLILNQKINDAKIENITSSPAIVISPTSTVFITPTFTLTPTPTTVPKATKVPAVSAPVTFDELFNRYGAIYGIDPAVLKKIADCESGFDPNQITGDYTGLFQFGSIPWQEARGRLGANPDLSLRFNAEESIRTAAHEIQFKGTSGWSDCD